MQKKITKKSLEIKKNDMEFYEAKLSNVSDYDQDYLELTCELGCMCCPKIKGFIPLPGMTVRFYGKGYGHTVRGIDIDGHISFYRTPEQAEEDHRKMCERYDLESRQAFKKQKKQLDKDYDGLPDFFQKRIDKFRRNNPDFRYKYESYEMFCCKEAVKIADTLKTQEVLERWAKLDWAEQKQMVDIDDGHSGNTFGCAVYLARLYLSEYPENVIELHGAMAPLVGSEEYGCVPKKQSQDEEK